MLKRTLALMLTFGLHTKSNYLLLQILCVFLPILLQLKTAKSKSDIAALIQEDSTLEILQRCSITTVVNVRAYRRNLALFVLK